MITNGPCTFVGFWQDEVCLGQRKVTKIMVLGVTEAGKTGQ